MTRLQLIVKNFIQEQTALQCVSEGTDHGLQVPISIVNELREVLRNAKPVRKLEVLEEMGLTIGTCRVQTLGDLAT